MAATGRTNNRETRTVAPGELKACRGCGAETTPALTAPVDLAVYPLEQGHRVLADLSQVTAWVCPGCGLVDLYADRPEYFRRPIRAARTIAP